MGKMFGISGVIGETKDLPGIVGKVYQHTSITIPGFKPARWSCRRPGLWFCYWLGKHYATARRSTNVILSNATETKFFRIRKLWSVTIFPLFAKPRKPETYGPFLSLAAVKRQIAGKENA